MLNVSPIGLLTAQHTFSQTTRSLTIWGILVITVGLRAQANMGYRVGNIRN